MKPITPVMFRRFNCYSALQNLRVMFFRPDEGEPSSKLQARVQKGYGPNPFLSGAVSSFGEANLVVDNDVEFLSG